MRMPAPTQPTWSSRQGGSSASGGATRTRPRPGLGVHIQGERITPVDHQQAPTVEVDVPRLCD